MTKPRVYIETSIPCFYFETRTEPKIVVRRDWTQQWWSLAQSRYELVTSVAVVDELARGTTELVKKRLDLVSSLFLLRIDEAVTSIVDSYIRNKVMPADPAGDALHLALASFHRCDFLVTWNCQHLANANKFGHIRRVNSTLGLFVPAIVTPLELMGGE